MKKRIILISTLLLFITLIGCSSSQNSSNDESGLKFVTGEIFLVNNEPFARIAVMNDKSLYLLDCSGKIKDSLSNNQGRRAKIYYSSVSVNKQSIKVLKVDKVELLESDN